MDKDEQEEHSDLNLRPKTMFDVKGRARTSDTTPENYLPQWSKDGEGFKKQYVAQEERDRRKNKVIRYSRDELLEMHVDSSTPPECPEGTPVITPESLPPVASIPFDYMAIYKQWAANKDRNRQPGRGRGQPRTDENTSSATPLTNNRVNNGTNNAAGGRSVGSSNANEGKRTSEDLNDSSTGRKWNDKRGGEDSWERGARIESSGDGDKDDLWDDVDPLGGEFKDMGLSTFAEAAEQFRREMDEMHRAGGRPELRQKTTMESEDQFADSVQEEDEPPMWDMPSTDNAPNAAVDAEPSDLSSWSSFNEQPAAPLHVNPVPVDAWFYLDPQGLQQGPFKSAEMREWFEAGYFKPHLPIRFGLEGEFASLANHFRHGQIPFSTVPSPNPTQHLLQQQQQLLLQKQQLEQQQFLANQLQQQRLLEQRRLQEEQQRRLQEEQRIRLEMQQRIELQEQAARLAQQQHFHYQRPTGPGAVGSAGAAIGAGWSGRTALPRDNIIPRARDSMMGGLGMFAGPPQPAKTEYAAPSWDTNDDVPNSSLWNSTVKNDSDLGTWNKPAEPESSTPWVGDEWNKEATPTAGWGASQVEPAPQASPKASWGLEEPSAQSSTWGKPDGGPPARSSSSFEPEASVEATNVAPKAVEPTWEAPPAPETPSLKQIQQDEQEVMRRRLKKQAQPLQPRPVDPQPAQPEQQPHLADMGQQLKRMLGVSNPSPPKSWGSQAATAPAPVARSLSLRDIQAEEERLAQLKRQEKPVQSSSRWSSVVTGTNPAAPLSAAVVTRPAPVEVKATPPKDRDASFWNFDASSPLTGTARPVTPGTSNGGNASDDLLLWASKQVKKLGGAEDLIQYCATLEDPGEIREYLAAYLGSTPKVSAFATEFIQKKKQLAGKKPSVHDTKASAFQKKQVGSNKHHH
ncbi:hypothetical protein, variant [Aphanomyces invadans]|uniref:GYF domain-containing protein n=1 Tax=Aphanomyces invadans TaxID=157072 RepID=A0A024UQ37_9STRA|nr:hypothetical protein, variant [Aphanomyces invadans]ETW08551.1 hypothetical protein, variant [Aphanomyces invadans]|eukprot:XP_008862356.1 hypothetical protein, variant [Aphanomyces invadans]